MTVFDSAAASLRHALWLALALALLLPPLAQAQAPAEQGAQGALLYHNYCSVCHGDRGDGKSRAAGALSTVPRDFSSEASRRELTRERIVLAITHGRPGTAMVGWKTQLSDADIGALADHVVTRFVQRDPGALEPRAAISGTQAHGGRAADATAPAARLDMTAAFPNKLKGSLARGSAFYMANCATCHGAGGDGAGPRAYFIRPKPRNFLDPATQARLNRVALFQAVSEGRVGTEMPAWKQVASAQQIADVAEYVFQAFVAVRSDGSGSAATGAAR
ncbi:MAG: c-type cytochrome [Burkholderiaceae bacterium]